MAFHLCLIIGKLLFNSMLNQTGIFKCAYNEYSTFNSCRMTEACNRFWLSHYFNQKKLVCILQCGMDSPELSAVVLEVPEFELTYLFWVFLCFAGLQGAGELIVCEMQEEAK